jgi:hypothetical protein
VAYQHPDGKHGMFTAALLEGLKPTRLNKGKVNSSDLISFIHDKKGWPQQPVCFHRGQTIELTRIEFENYALFKRIGIEERDVPSATPMVDNTIDRESKNGLNKKITDKQKWPEDVLSAMPYLTGRKDIEKRPKSEALEPDKVVKPKCSHIEDLFTPILKFIFECEKDHLDRKVPCEPLINEVADKCDVDHKELRGFLVNMAREDYIEFQYWNKPICKVFLRPKGREQLRELTVAR